MTPWKHPFTPARTTIRLDFRAQGRAALRTLLDRIDGGIDTALEVPAPTLILRGSTGPSAPHRSDPLPVYRIT
ncbi:substrate-binding domain-containing protein [Plantibacter flavus]|uniref:substrate-binding domain-containing protein n=1 Tax=Plantibacter flavus TaxID=150123 RepID=UPI003F13542E